MVQRVQGNIRLSGEAASTILYGAPRRVLDAGARPEIALVRQLDEELGIEVEEVCLAPLTFASHADPDFHLLLPFYVCCRSCQPATLSVIQPAARASARAIAAVPRQRFSNRSVDTSQRPIVAST